MKCSICGKEIIGYGNNAYPVNAGTCCDECNMTVVLPTRLADISAMKTIRELNFETAEEGLEQLRSLNSTGVVSNDKYNYIVKNWDRLIGVKK